MKYFTPELLAECRSSDPDVAEAAAARWQRKVESYRKRLQEFLSRLPPGARRLTRSVALHDARVVTINLAEERGRTRFFLTLELAGKGRRAGAQLRYDLVKPLDVVFHEPNAPENAALSVLYDEFDVTSQGTPTHSILMTGGVEIRVRFTNLHLTPFTRVVAPGRGRTDRKELAELAAP